jgi:hypothetical protein
LKNVRKQQTGYQNQINWVHYLEAVLPATVRAKQFPGGMRDLARADVRVAGVELFQKLERMVRALPNATLKAYMDWRLILAEVDALDDRYLDAEAVLAEELIILLHFYFYLINFFI